jgi:hypothetical protein
MLLSDFAEKATQKQTDTANPSRGIPADEMIYQSHGRQSKPKF